LWHPDSTWLRFVDETLFGNTDANVYFYNFPIVPWFSLYFASSVIGELIGAYHLERNERGIRHALGALAIVSTGVAAVGTVLALWLMESPASHPLPGRPYVLRQAEDFDEVLRAAESLAEPGPTGRLTMRLTSPFQKLPPSPIYLALYGGIGMALLYACHVLQRRPSVRGVLDWASAVGRASFFAFVVQYYVYYTITQLLALPPSPWGLLYFIGSVLFIGWLVRLWCAYGGNRYITVGYPWFLVEPAQVLSDPASTTVRRLT
jgi:hypothetical protein